MYKRIMFEALSKRKGNIGPVLAGTETGRFDSFRTEHLNFMAKVSEPKIRTSGPCPEWVRLRWPESPVDLGAQIHQQINRMVRHQDHELAKAVLFGNWDAMKEYCEMDVKATQEALNATNKIMAAMEDTLELDLFDLPEEPEYDGDDLMAAVRSFC